MVAQQGNQVRTKRLLDFNRRCEETLKLFPKISSSSSRCRGLAKQKMEEMIIMMNSNNKNDDDNQEEETTTSSEESSFSCSSTSSNKEEDQKKKTEEATKVFFTKEQVEALLDLQMQYNAQEIKILQSVAQDLRKTRK